MHSDTYTTRTIRWYTYHACCMTDSKLYVIHATQHNVANNQLRWCNTNSTQQLLGNTNNVDLRRILWNDNWWKEALEGLKVKITSNLLEYFDENLLYGVANKQSPAQPTHPVANKQSGFYMHHCHCLYIELSLRSYPPWKSAVHGHDWFQWLASSDDLSVLMEPLVRARHKIVLRYCLLDSCINTYIITNCHSFDVWFQYKRPHLHPRLLTWFSLSLTHNTFLSKLTKVRICCLVDVTLPGHRQP